MNIREAFEEWAGIRHKTSPEDYDKFPDAIERAIIAETAFYAGRHSADDLVRRMKANINHSDDCALNSDTRATCNCGKWEIIEQAQAFLEDK